MVLTDLAAANDPVNPVRDRLNLYPDLREQESDLLRESLEHWLALVKADQKLADIRINSRDGREAMMAQGAAQVLRDYERSLTAFIQQLART